ncbi:MAG: EAL domain-containing protein [Lysobacterales bacterium]
MSASAHSSSDLEHLTEVFATTETVAVISRLSDGLIVALSPGVEALFGAPRSRMLGRTALELGFWPGAEQRDSMLNLLRERGLAVGEAVAIHTPTGRDYDGLMTCTLITVDDERFIFTLIQDIHAHDSEARAQARQAASFRTLIMESQVGVYRRLMDPPRLSEANPALAKMLGYASPEALLAASVGMPAFDYVDATHAQTVAARLEQVGRITDVRAELHRKDGSSLWVSESATALRGSDGSILQIDGTLIDITIQVRAEQALSQSEALYRNLVENSRDGVFLMQHGRVIFANDALGEILGYRSEEMIGASYFDWVAPEDMAAQAERKNARESGSSETQEYEIHLLRRDGSRCLCAVRAGAVNFRGEPASIGTLRDITEARAQQARLQAAEERYRLLFKHAVLGMFQSTLEGDLIEVNEAMARMFGYESPEAMRAEAPSIRRRYSNPDMRDRALKTILRDGQILGWEFEMLRRNGEHFWVLSSARIVRPHADDPGHLEGSLLDISARRAAEQELKFLAHHDSLTGLSNRRSFELQLVSALERLRASDDGPYGVFLLDLDRFKVVNDSLGHAAGDELLVQFSERLRSAMDARTLVARYGGDEFALLCRQSLDASSAKALADLVQSIARTPFQVRGHQVFSGASIGIVLVNHADQDPESILRDADTAMFRAKSKGSGYALFDQRMHAAARARLALETDLRFAVNRGELVPYFQPMWSLREQRVVGVEALVRWQHPQRGLLAPAEFLDVAEETGLLSAIDLQMLEMSLRQLLSWRSAFGDRAPSRLSVNISDRLFASRSFPAELHQLLEASGANPAQLQLEITETVFRGAPDRLRGTLAALKSLGVGLVVDDFGTGYSSLVSFSEAAFDGLKIDRGFVHDLEHNQRHRAIVRTITQFARDLDLSLVAEGVENEIQANLLAQLGCDLVQGYLYAPPLAAPVMADWFRDPSPRRGSATPV